MINLTLPILPQAELEQDFQTPLQSVLETKLSSLSPERQQTLDDILAYSLNPFQFTPLTSLKSLEETTPTELNKAPFFWQKLLLSETSLCSEIVLLAWQDSLYLTGLNILPPTLGLLAPMKPKDMAQWVTQLVKYTLQNVQGLAMQLGLRGIVSTVYNPNLALMFRQFGFVQDNHRTEIVGLPLPAIFYLDFLANDKQKCLGNSNSKRFN